MLWDRRAPPATFSRPTPPRRRSTLQPTPMTSPVRARIARTGEALRAASVLSDGAPRHPATIRAGTHLWEPPVRFAGAGSEMGRIEREPAHHIPVRTSAESLRTALSDS